MHFLYEYWVAVIEKEKHDVGFKTLCSPAVVQSEGAL